MEPVTVLATSVGNDAFPAVLDALRNNGERAVRVLGVDADPAVAGLRLCDLGWSVPPRREDAELLDRLLRICAEHDVQVLFPLSTEDQDFFAARRSLFEDRGIAVITSSSAALDTANDKLALLRRATEVGVPCPAFVELTNLDQLDSFAAGFGFPERPCVLKLNRGTGSRGVKVIDAAIDPTERLFDRMNHRVLLSDVHTGLRGVDPLPPLHLTEYLPGPEYSIDVLCREGVALASVVRDRRSTMFGMATHAIVVDLPNVDSLARAIVRACGLSYVVNVQFRCDDLGAPRLLEINPRIPGTIALSVAAGINMPYLALKMALGESVDEIPPPRFGTQLARYGCTISWE